jgi:DNA-binding NarL/FixJ family response regulator
MIFDLSKLTMREREVYALVREGKSSKDTCEALGISLSTVRFHRNGIYRKLGIAPFLGGQRRIEAQYRDSLKDCEFNCLLAIASFSQRLDKLECRS